MKLQSGETTTGVKRGPAPTSPSSIQPAGMPNPESARRSQTDEFPASSHANPTMSPASLPPIGIADTVPGGSGMSSRRNLCPSPAEEKECAAVEVANTQSTTARISVRSRIFRFFRRVFPASAGARAACPGDQAVRSSHQPRRTTRASRTALAPATYPRYMQERSACFVTIESSADPVNSDPIGPQAQLAGARRMRAAISSRSAWSSWSKTSSS